MALITVLTIILRKWRCITILRSLHGVGMHQSWYFFLRPLPLYWCIYLGCIGYRPKGYWCPMPCIWCRGWAGWCCWTRRVHGCFLLVGIGVVCSMPFCNLPVALQNLSSQPWKLWVCALPKMLDSPAHLRLDQQCVRQLHQHKFNRPAAEQSQQCMLSIIQAAGILVASIDPFLLTISCIQHAATSIEWND